MKAQLFRHMWAPAAIICILTSALLLPFYAEADVYRYVDENQVIHLTNVPVNSRFKLLIKEKLPQSDSKLLPVSRAQYEAVIMETANKYGVDCDLVKAVIKVESNFNSKAVSKKGAKGLMQLMPQTASMLGVNDCFHPQTNIDGGIRHLSYLLGVYNNNLFLALAAYNAGERAVAKYAGIPPYAETKTYVRLVLDNYEIYKRKSMAGVVALASTTQNHFK